MQLSLYQFSKAPNSTKLPSGTGVSVSGELRAPCSLAAPSLLFTDANTAASLTIYNYAHIPAFSRYFFIRNWTYQPGGWVATMDVDVLASFKDVIGESTQYVARSASKWDGDVLDNSYPTKNVTTTSLASGSITDAWSREGIGSPCYVLGVSTSSQHFYRMDEGDLAIFFHYLYSDEYINQLYDGNWSEKYPQLKINLNPIQYVDSLMWYPFSPASAPSGSIQVGWGEISMSTRSVPAIHSGIYVFPTIPKHPQAATRGGYLNLSPWSAYYLSFPPWGIIQLDSLTLSGADGVTCRYYVDFTTGAGTLNIYASREGVEILLDSRTSQIGTAVKYSAIISNGYGLVSNLPNTARALGAASSFLGPGALTRKKFLSGMDIGSGVSAIADMVGDAVSAALPYGGSTNLGSGRNGLKGPLSLTGRFVNIVDEDLQHHGRPLCHQELISNLAGYVQVTNAEVEAPEATADELNRIISLMEGGFLFE